MNKKPVNNQSVFIDLSQLLEYLTEDQKIALDGHFQQNATFICRKKGNAYLLLENGNKITLPDDLCRFSYWRCFRSLFESKSEFLLYREKQEKEEIKRVIVYAMESLTIDQLRQIKSIIG